MVLGLAIVASGALVRGDSWNLISTRSPAPMFSFGLGTARFQQSLLLVNPADPNLIYAVGADGLLWQTTDGGGVWQVPIRTSQEVVLAVTLSKSAPHSVYAIGLNAFYRSTDDGTTWTSGSIPKINGIGPRDLAADSRDAGVLYAAVETACFITCLSGGVLTSIDGGRHWTATVIPSGMSRVIADAVQSGVVYGADDSGFTYRSDDRGASWHRIANISAVLAFDPVNPMIIYGGSADARGDSTLVESLDRGDHWTQLGSLPRIPISPNREATTAIFAIAVNPTNPAIIDVGGSLGAFRSMDGGLTWAANNNGLCCSSGSPVPLPVFAMAYDQSGRLIATTFLGLLAFSADEKSPRRRTVRH